MSIVGEILLAFVLLVAVLLSGAAIVLGIMFIGAALLALAGLGKPTDGKDET